MAILGKIRERSIFLIIIIGLALFAFVLTGLFDPGSPLFSQNMTSVGEINGDNISREEFAEMVEQQRLRNGNRGSQLQNVNTAWNTLVRERIYQSQLEKSGVTVGEKDVWDEIIKQPFVQTGAQFQNEAGLFDEDIFKEYIATLQDAKDNSEQDRAAWLGWINYERSIKSNLELRTYNNLITAGMGVTLKEGERHYINNNTKLDLEYVYVPYTFIADSLVSVSDDEIKTYVKARPDQFQAKAERDLSFVKFDIKATAEDEKAIKDELALLVNDREEFNKAAKTTIPVIGLSNVEKVEDFFRENSSDTPLNLAFTTKSMINAEVADSILNLSKGAVYGPYKEGEYFKLTKLMDTKQLPDSVKSRHILIPFVGAMRATPSITQTEVQAKSTADSLLAILKKDKSKFEQFVTDFSSDQGSVSKGGKYDWYPYTQMVAEFRDFTFENEPGSIEVVQTPFGFHIIEIEGQKNVQTFVSLATFSRQIVPSEDTENAIFQEAETFASEITSGKDIVELAKENNYAVQPVKGLKSMDDRVSNLNNQRQIVTWAFEKPTEVGDIKRFDTDNGYVVAALTGKRKEGVSLGNSGLRVRKLLLDEKKAAMIVEKMSADNLVALAESFDSRVNSSRAVSLGSPVLPGVGRAPAIIETLVALTENKLYKGIEAQNGVFAVKILKKESPAALENYNSSTLKLLTDKRAKSQKSYEILKKFADIEDNRALFY